MRGPAGRATGGALAQRRDERGHVAVRRGQAVEECAQPGVVEDPATGHHDEIGDAVGIAGEHGAQTGVGVVQRAAHLALPHPVGPPCGGRDLGVLQPEAAGPPRRGGGGRPLGVGPGGSDACRVGEPQHDAVCGTVTEGGRAPVRGRG